LLVELRVELRGLEPVPDQAKHRTNCSFVPFHFISVPLVTCGYVSGLDGVNRAVAIAARSAPVTSK
jgi:hypothetical protein